MKVLYTDPIGDLSIEHEVLGSALATDQNAPEEISVLVVHQQQVNSEYLDQFPRLKGIIRLGVGYDKIDLKACQQRQIEVTNIPDYCRSEVADTTLAMILNLVRGLDELAFRLRQEPEHWQKHTLSRVRRSSKLTLGIIGAGRIGSAVIERAKAFGFRCQYYDPWVESCQGAERILTLADLLLQADIVSLHVPLNEDTTGMVDTHFIHGMKKGALFVNTARGKLIDDENVVLQALKIDHLAGVALDVLLVEPPAQEPLISAWLSKDSWLQGRLILSPHNAFFAAEGIVELRQKALHEAQRKLRGMSFTSPIIC